MAEDNEPFGEIGRAGQQASDASQRAKRYNDREGATGESVKFLKESADLQQKLVSLLADEAALIEQIKDGKKSLVDLAKLQENKEELILKSKQNQNILDGVGSFQSKQQNRAMTSVLKSVDKIKGITAQDVELNKKKNSLLGKAELNMDMLSDLTGGLAPKAMKFIKAFNMPLAIVSAVIGLVKMLISVNNEIAEIGRGLGVSADEARKVRANFAAIQGASSNVLNTTAEISKAQSTLNDALGTSATMISGRILDGMATLQNRMGLTAEAATSFAQSALLSGKSVNQLKLDAIGSAAAVERERGTRLDIRGILKETGTITGQIRAQLGGSVEAIASAVAKAKSLGMELKGVAAAGKQLLNFEQSISAELEAELLTGRQINLERARLAALTGDYSTLTEEINANVGDFYEFSKLNVLQQEQLARAVGMEADQLSNILMKRANLDQLAQEAENRGERELARNYMQLSLQQKFAAALEKLKVFVVNIVAAMEDGSIGLLDILNMDKQMTLGQFDTTSDSFRGFGKDKAIEDAVERGMSKARITVQTRYDNFNGVNGTNNAKVAFSSKNTGN